MLHAFDTGIIILLFRRQFRNLPVLFPAGGKEHRGILPFGAKASVVGSRDGDGRHDFRRGHAAGVTELVAEKGIAGNWLWWNMVAGSVLTVFFFAKLWRRAGIMTDVEIHRNPLFGQAPGLSEGIQGDLSRRVS